MIKVITGIRRCGKSCLMQIIVGELRENGIPEKNLIFLNLDKRGYKNIRTAEQLEDLLDQVCTGPGIKYLFIDEIQNVKGFEEVINAFREEDEYSIFITGSNSYLLSGELITKLTGRYIEFEIFPLTFDEYLGMKKFLGQSVDQDTASELDKYIREGGFPKTLEYENPDDKRIYIHSTFSEIFEKDIRRSMNSIETANREYVPLESIRDNYPKYVVTRNDPIQQRNGIIHVNIGQFMRDSGMF